MLDIVLKEKDTGKPLWLDLTAPSEEELRQLEAEYGILSNWLDAATEVGHLPKFEKVGNTTFLIIRGFDQECTTSDDNLRKTTGKVAIFLGDRFLITLHRKEQPFLQKIKSAYKDSKEEIFLQVLLLEIIQGAIESYRPLLSQAELRIEDFERSVLEGKLHTKKWREILRAKSRLSVAKRMLIHSLQVVQRFQPSSSANTPAAQDLREQIEGLIFYADSLLDDLTSLQNMQVSLASHRLNESSNRTNEVMRLLTVFSLFFLPLNFIVGLYGMNFTHMPELHWQYGYAYVWAIMITTAVSFYIWFWRKGWLRSSKEKAPALLEKSSNGQTK